MIKRCPICGKEFMPAVFHTYKIYDKRKLCYELVCSWHCLRKREKKNDKN